MIKNIIFDWGGVLIHLDRQRCAEVFAKYGVQVGDELTNPYGHRRDLMNFELGLMSVDEFHDTIRRIYGEGLTNSQIDEAWNALLVGIPTYKLDTLLELRKDYRLFLLSNTNALHWEEGRKHFEYKGLQMEDYFDQIFLSHELHELKPAPEIFLKVAEMANIKPEETLFVDDLDTSCKSAESLGFQTYCPQANTDWRGELRIKS